ncbi:MAG: DUF202 domain-containing protein [Candidatus Bathyarchaeota archaeon]|nr:DUF202 domain-containing protein [Candidatus Bathyarchaeota archaeon]
MNDNTRLALIRTLLAAERNYLAIERTQLSQLRTGLSLAVIAPSAAATLSYAFSYFPETSQFEIIFFVFLTCLTVFGTYMSFSSYRKVRKTRSIRKLIHKKEIEVMSEAELVSHYFKDILVPNT